LILKFDFITILLLKDMLRYWRRRL